MTKWLPPVLTIIALGRWMAQTLRQDDRVAAFASPTRVMARVAPLLAGPCPAEKSNHIPRIVQCTPLFTSGRIGNRSRTNRLLKRAWNSGWVNWCDMCRTQLRRLRRAVRTGDGLRPSPRTQSRRRHMWCSAFSKNTPNDSKNTLNVRYSLKS